MKTTPAWVEVGICPACRRAELEPVAGAVNCRACAARYPLLAGLPWLFREPALVLGEWQNRLRLYLEEFRLEERIVRRELASTALGAAGHARLTQLADGYAGQAVAVEHLLRPLALASLPAPHAAMLGFDVKVPRHQDLHSYYVNLHRDWAWGDAENSLSVEAIAGVLPEGRWDRVLVLGAGGCRLAYDLHELGRSGHTVALDINPLLLLAARAVLAGEGVELYEFPIAPRRAADHAILRRLRAPRVPRPGLELVFGDALEAPFAPGTFDLVVTPWLIDIIDDELAAFAARVNGLLRPGGTWVNFGSLSFASVRPSARLGVDEVWEQLAASGFEVTARSEREIPYMRSPASRHSRQEVVLTFAARKARAAAPPAPAQPLPAWLMDPRLPVPLGEHLEVTAVASRLQAFTLTLVNGERSAADLAGFLVAQKLLGEESALAAVRGLLLRLHQGQRRSPPGV